MRDSLLKIEAMPGAHHKRRTSRCSKYRRGESGSQTGSGGFAQLRAAGLLAHLADETVPGGGVVGGDAGNTLEGLEQLAGTAEAVLFLLGLQLLEQGQNAGGL